MKDLVLLGAVAAVIYFVTRDGEAIPAAEGLLDGIRDGAPAAITEREFPLYTRRAAGAPLPPSAQGPGPFGEVVVTCSPPLLSTSSGYRSGNT